MEYQKIIDLLENTPNQQPKFRTKNLIEINNQIRFKTSMLKSSLYEYNDVCILMSGNITVAELAASRGNNSMLAVFKNYAPFTDCISEINNIQINNARDTDVVMSMYNLIEYSDNYLKRSGCLWQCYKDQPALTDAGAAGNFPCNSDLFKLKQKITGTSGADSTRKIKIMMTLKCLSNFRRTLAMSLINCEIYLMLT